MPNAEFAAARSAGATDIPIVDIGQLLAGGPHAPVAEQIMQAASSTGFFYLSGHGIEPRLLAQAFAVAADFFALPPALKSTIAVNTQQRGWMATGMSRLENSETHDLKEVFFWGPELAPDHSDILAQKPLVALNQWPREVFPRLQTELTPYYDAVCKVARVVLAAIATGLGREADFFASRYQAPLARGQLVYYPPSSPNDEQAGRYGVAPHTDFGVLTLLLQDDSGGLQVRTRSGDWIEAPPIAGTLVCNFGDLLQRWSNDRLLSTVHRVINRSGGSRYSIPVFFDPSSDAVVDPCDFNVERSDARHTPITAGEYIVARNRRNFTQYA